MSMPEAKGRSYYYLWSGKKLPFEGDELAYIEEKKLKSYSKNIYNSSLYSLWSCRYISWNRLM